MKKIKLSAQEKRVSLLEIQNFENEHNLMLSESYKAFLASNNGGVPEERIYWDSENEIELGVAHFEALKYGYYPLEKIIEKVYEDEVIPNGFFPFASDGGSGKYLLSMNNEDFGSIHVIYSDSTEPLRLCNSFEDFIDRLEKE